MPESAVTENSREQSDRMLNEFNQALHADLLLTNLPARLPDGYCSSAIHLNQRGQQFYTRLLAAEVQRLLP